ncbi:hypothetical protein TRFO_33121 [Tritrichomonas foetus]|uniref:Phosphoprotein phosphatase n=1 Tax=Tritrichomonas foetus TaxID=1144522 RepID=A0A1J4JRT1_9EUKA|nr:hypothetical protein TRFO_33121 [Tritrichomonas foetus]|eukprot:OHT00246.1 hypothetical protein TRFO_33121 [Tritrichomonas foetus]
MSLIRNYASKRNSSLTRFSPVNSPIRHIFKPNQFNMRLNKLQPINGQNKDDDENDDENQQKNGNNGDTSNKNGDKNDKSKKDDKKKKSDAEPVCDLEPIPGFAQNANKVHSKIELPVLPPLPSPGNNDFTSALQKKISLIAVELDFLDPLGDVAAKEVRLKTNNELLEVCQNSFDKLSVDDKEILYEGTKKILFKDLAPVQPNYLFCDDLVTLIDGAWDHTKLLYQILTIFALSAPRPELPKLLFRQFNKFDLNERNQIIDVINQLLEKDPKIVPDILKRCCNMISTYLDGATNPYVLVPTVSLITAIFKKASDVTPYESIYLNNILPLLGAIHFPTCAENMVQIVEQFVKAKQDLVMPTITELVRHFPRTRSVKTISFLKMLTISMTKMNTRSFRKSMKQLFHLFVKCTVGPQIKVSDASLSIWHKIELEPLIMDNARVIFPFVYPILSKGMREVWSQDIINNIDDIFQTMNRIDSFIFQELCRQKQPQAVPTNDHLKTWATIARSAAKTDRGLNLATKLAEIQRIFAVQQLQPIGGVGPNSNPQLRNRSDPKLSSTPQSPPPTGNPRGRSSAAISKNPPLPPFKAP